MHPAPADDIDVRPGESSSLEAKPLVRTASPAHSSGIATARAASLPQDTQEAVPVVSDASPAHSIGIAPGAQSPAQGSDSPVISSGAKLLASPLLATASPKESSGNTQGSTASGGPSNSSPERSNDIAASSPNSNGAVAVASIASVGICPTPIAVSTSDVINPTSTQEEVAERSVSETYEDEFCDYDDDDFDEASEDAEENSQEASQEASQAPSVGFDPAPANRAAPGQIISTDTPDSARSVGSAASAVSEGSHCHSPAESPKSARSASASSVDVPCDLANESIHSAHDSDEDEE